MAIVLPLAALVIAGLAIAGVWLWWTSARDADASPPASYPEQDSSPARSPERYSGVEEEMEGSFLSRLADAFKPVGSDSSPARPVDSTGTAGMPAFTAAPHPPVGPVADAIEVMRILRDLADGSVIVEIDGQRYRRLADITDAQVGRRFIGNAQALAQFAHLGDLNIPDDWSAPPIAPAVQLTPPAPSAPLPSDWQAVPPPPQPASSEVSDPGRRGGLFGGGRTSEEEEVAPARSMAEQIEELLQYRLTATPDLAHRSIHIRPALDGGVRIEVDGKFYEGISDVPDQHIREFIQSTIHEWEARQ